MIIKDLLTMMWQHNTHVFFVVDSSFCVREAEGYGTFWCVVDLMAKRGLFYDIVNFSGIKNVGCVCEFFCHSIEIQFCLSDSYVVSSICQCQFYSCIGW